MKTVTEIRKAFWANHEQFAKEFRAKKRQNDYHCDIRVSFVDFVESLRRDGQITEKLARRVTL